MLLDLKKIIEEYDCKITGIFHVGAHYGEEIETYNELGISEVMYFEPLKEAWEVLSKKIPPSHLFKMALGNETKQVTLNVDSGNNGQSSSILKPKLHLAQYPHIKFEKTEEVSQYRLDDVPFIKDNIKHYNMINMDVQGYELEVLKGAINTITSQIDYIMTEVNREELYENCVQVSELDKFLNALYFYRVETSWEGKTWGDAFYIKDKS